MRGLEVSIETINLAKSFKGLTAVDDVSFQVKKGELFGLLGPNGAGKTTTIRMLCTLLSPTSGTARVAGYDIVKEPARVRAKIGVVSEGVMLYRDLTAHENLKLLGKLYRVAPAELEGRIRKLLDFLDLSDRANDLVGNFSTGLMKRTQVAAALIHEPEVLFLDEVTSGLDPQSATSLREFTRDLCRQGITTIWTTHYMFEPERLCDRVAIINRGKLLIIDTPDMVRNTAKDFDVLEVTAANLDDRVLSKIRATPGVLGLFLSNEVLRIMVKDHEAVFSDILETIKVNGGDVRSVNVTVPSLEEAFISLTRGDTGARNA